MLTNYVFIDFKNIQPTSLDDLKEEWFRVWIFLGEHQRNIPVGLAKALPALGKETELMTISGNGRNALDFHIAYYLGKLCSENPESYFHIVSKDRGFDPLVAHLREKKLHVARVEEIEEIPLVQRAKAKTVEDRVKLLVAKIKDAAGAGPTTWKKLSNMIGAFFLNRLGEDEVEEVVNALEKKRVVKFEGTKVAYL